MDCRRREPVDRSAHVPAAQARMIQALCQSLRSGPEGTSVELVETHISWVLIAGDRAWKLKKAVAPGFLDFRSVQRRRHFCEEEVRLNRRLAPMLYLDVVPVTGSASAPKLGGHGAAIDWAVAMRAFDRDGQWDRLARCGALQPRHVDALAERIARLHQEAEPARIELGYGSPASVRSTMRDTLDAVRAAAPGGAQTIAALARWEAETFPQLEPVFQRRFVDGRVREGHGDLHLGNVAEVDGQTVAFDGIEFDPALRWIDVASEVAFMAMDLIAHGLPALGHRFANAYFERSGDYDGLRTWRWYLVYRALVRSRVAALRNEPADIARYLAIALEAAAPPRPALIATHGFSGSGKTTLAGAVVERFGAVRLRADIERRRCAGLDPFTRPAARPDASLYTPQVTAATYDRLCALARSALEGGTPVVLDATFLAREQRDRARAFARAQHVPFILLDLQADDALLRERIGQRSMTGTDASEADLDVLEHQTVSADPLASDEADGVLTCRDGAPVDGWERLARRIGE